MSRKILVTGGSGFIGGYIVKELAGRGDNVLNFDISEPSPKIAWLQEPVAEDITFQKGDVRNWSHILETVKTFEPDAIIHSAAITDLALLSQQPQLALNVNFLGTFNVLEATRIFAVKRLVYISSRSVLPSAQYDPIDTNHPLLLATEGTSIHFYSASKLASEAFCWAYHESFGLDFIIIRPTAIYGLGREDSLVLKRMVEESIRGLPVHIDKQYPYSADTHAMDVADITIKALDIPSDQIRDRVFYAATGEPLTTIEQAADIVHELIPEAEIVIHTDTPMETTYPKLGVLSIQNGLEQLGFQPKFSDLRTGIAEYIEVSRKFFSAFETSSE
jgi:nucleoside-diphosphate-sugar epimerase